jgi:pimeloyl-ACP methyl ester carboxylesterase
LWQLQGFTASEANEPANFIQFPYDWRRDNRYNARRLKRTIDNHLHRWRRYSGALDARVILVTHSMGGLIARYYLEVLEGWPDCKALVTLGTPHRGSLNALGFLVNGIRQVGVDMTEAIRSFTSMYQLLPTYPVIRQGSDSVCRVADLRDLPGVDNSRAVDALNFHHEIMSAVEQHRRDARYLDPRTGCQVLPIVGVQQPTNQSASWTAATLTVAREVSAGTDTLLEDGDGTVPRLSAIPVELSQDFRQSFFPERHGAIQRNQHVLQHLQASLEQMQVRGLGAIRGFDVEPSYVSRPAISLDMEDLYGSDEPVTFRVRLLNASDAAVPPKARIQPAVGGPATTYRFHKASAGEWTLSVEDLPPALYRIEVDAPDPHHTPPPAVHDLFEVVGKELPSAS